MRVKTTFLSLLIVLILMAACTNLQRTSPSELTGIDICLSGSVGNAVLILAQQAGIFEKHGLSANLITVDSGATAANALIAGDADACLMGSASFVNAALAGEDMVMTAGIINQMFFAFATVPEIKSAQDLQGRTLGSSGPGNTSDLFLRLALSSLGLDPDRDVTIVTIGRSSDRLAAMETGQIAGTAVLVTDVGATERLGFPVLVTAAELGVPFQHSGIVMRREFVSNNRGTVSSFTRVLLEAIAMMKQDRAQALAALAETLELDPQNDAAYLDEIYDSFVEKYLERVPLPTAEGLQLVIEQGRSENPTGLNIKPEEIIDRSFVEALLKDGYIDNLYDGE